jgi:hypothetical protein
VIFFEGLATRKTVVAVVAVVAVPLRLAQAALEADDDRGETEQTAFPAVRALVRNELIRQQGDEPEYRAARARYSRAGCVSVRGLRVRIHEEGRLRERGSHDALHLKRARLALLV